MNTQILSKKAEDMKKKAKKNKKGFTLVELIVVLVIIAILAAVLVPTMSGYIGKAKKTAAESACKNVVTAANSAGTDLIASGDSIPTSDNTTEKNNFLGHIIEVGGTNILKGVTSIELDPATGSVLYVGYTDGTYSCSYKDGKYNPEKKSTPTEGTSAAGNNDKVVIYTGVDPYTSGYPTGTTTAAQNPQ